MEKLGNIKFICQYSNGRGWDGGKGSEFVMFKSITNDDYRMFTTTPWKMTKEGLRTNIHWYSSRYCNSFKLELIY